MQPSTPPYHLQGSSIFIDLPYSLAPLAYHTTEVHRYFHDAGMSGSGLALRLAQLLGVKVAPTPDDVVGWLDQIGMLRPTGEPLSASELQLALNGLTTLVESPRSSYQHLLQRITAPDQRGVMRPLRDLVVDDAPWLRNPDKLDYHRLNLAHNLLLRNVALVQRSSVADGGDGGSSGRSRGRGGAGGNVMGHTTLSDMLSIRRLSECVVETIRPGFEPPLLTPQPPDVERWNRTIRSIPFRNGLRQVSE